MATARKTTATKAAPTLTWDNVSTVEAMLTAADTYVKQVRDSALDALTDRVAFTSEARKAYRPMFDVAVAEWRKANADKAYSTSTFVTKLTERGKVIRNDESYSFPIGTRDLNVILNWDDSLVYDADDADSPLAWFVTWCGKQNRDLTWSGFVQFLKGFSDPAGNQYTEDGERSARGKQLDAESAATEAMTADDIWHSFDFKLNLEGMPPAGKLAWIDAAIHDLESLRKQIIKAAGSEAAKVKRDAKSVLESNVKAGIPIGGDKITKAIENATARAAQAQPAAA